MNSKIKLALVATSAAGAAVSLIGQTTAALAGPELTGTKFNNYAATANYALQAGQSISISGNTNSFSITPFAVSADSLGSTGTGATLGNSALGNAGTSTLTAAFDNNGILANGIGQNGSNFTNSTIGSPSFAVQAGVLNLGGQGATFGVTSGPNIADGSGTKSFNVPTSIVLNQGSTGIATIVLASAGTGTTVGVSTTTTTIGASSATGSLSDQFTVINSLTAF